MIQAVPWTQSSRYPEESAEVVIQHGQSLTLHAACYQVLEDCRSNSGQLTLPPRPDALRFLAEQLVHAASRATVRYWRRDPAHWRALMQTLYPRQPDLWTFMPRLRTFDWTWEITPFTLGSFQVDVPAHLPDGDVAPFRFSLSASDATIASDVMPLPDEIAAAVNASNQLWIYSHPRFQRDPRVPSYFGAAAGQEIINVACVIASNQPAQVEIDQAKDGPPGTFNIDPDDLRLALSGPRWSAPRQPRYPAQYPPSAAEEDDMVEEDDEGDADGENGKSERYGGYGGYGGSGAPAAQVAGWQARQRPASHNREESLAPVAQSGVSPALSVSTGAPPAGAGEWLHVHADFQAAMAETQASVDNVLDRLAEIRSALDTDFALTAPLMSAGDRRTQARTWAIGLLDAVHRGSGEASFLDKRPPEVFGEALLAFRRQITVLVRLALQVAEHDVTTWRKALTLVCNRVDGGHRWVAGASLLEPQQCSRCGAIRQDTLSPAPGPEPDGNEFVDSASARNSPNNSSSRRSNDSNPGYGADIREGEEDWLN